MQRYVYSLRSAVSDIRRIERLAHNQQEDAPVLPDEDLGAELALQAHGLVAEVAAWAADEPGAPARQEPMLRAMGVLTAVACLYGKIVKAPNGTTLSDPAVVEDLAALAREIVEGELGRLEERAAA